MKVSELDLKVVSSINNLNQEKVEEVVLTSQEKQAESLYYGDKDVDLCDSDNPCEMFGCPKDN